MGGKPRKPRPLALQQASSLRRQAKRRFGQKATGIAPNSFVELTELLDELDNGLYWIGSMAKQAAEAAGSFGTESVRAIVRELVGARIELLAIARDGKVEEYEYQHLADARNEEAAMLESNDYQKVVVRIVLRPQTRLLVEELRALAKARRR